MFFLQILPPDVHSIQFDIRGIFHRGKVSQDSTERKWSFTEIQKRCNESSSKCPLFLSVLTRFLGQIPREVMYELSRVGGRLEAAKFDFLSVGATSKPPHNPHTASPFVAQYHSIQTFHKLNLGNKM